MRFAPKDDFPRRIFLMRFDLLKLLNHLRARLQIVESDRELANVLLAATSRAVVLVEALNEQFAVGRVQLAHRDLKRLPVRIQRIFHDFSLVHQHPRAALQPRQFEEAIGFGAAIHFLQVLCAHVKLNMTFALVLDASTDRKTSVLLVLEDERAVERRAMSRHERMHIDILDRAELDLRVLVTVKDFELEQQRR